MIKRRIFYLVILLSALWLMIMYEGAFVELIFSVTVAVPIILIVIKYIIRANLNCQWRIEAGVPAQVGKSVVLSAIIHNMVFFPVNKVEIKFAVSDINNCKKTYVMSTNLMPYMMRKCVMDITPAYSGNLDVELKEIIVYDYFGLTRSRKKLKSQLKIPVFPVMEYIPVEMLQTNKVAVDEGNSYSNSTPGSDKTQIFDVSPYKNGDNIKDIHWKLSLKTDEYMIKRYSQPVSNVTNIFVDISRPTGKRAENQGMDKLFTNLFSLIEELKRGEDIVNIYAFDDTGKGYNSVTLEELLLASVDNMDNMEQILETFKGNIGNGRNILVSTRIDESQVKNLGELEIYYIDIDWEKDDDGGELVIGETCIIGMDVWTKTSRDKEFVELGDELSISSDDEDIRIYTHLLRAIMVVLGSFVPLAVLQDIIILYENPFKIIVYGMAGFGVMLAIEYIPKTKLKIICTVLGVGTAAIMSGIEAISIGAHQFIMAFVNNIQILELEYGLEFGLIEEAGYELEAFFGFLAFILSVVLFIFTWKSVSISIHIIASLPLVIVCFIFGCVPEGLYIILLLVYLTSVLIYGISYNSIVKNEKNVLKKAFYESTLNIGAFSSYIATFAIVAVCIFELVTGYERSDILSCMKETINVFISEYSIEDILGGETVAVGGMSRGELGQADKVEYDNQTRLKVTVEGNIEFPLYLRSYIGSEYTGNSWDELPDEASNKMELGMIRYGVNMDQAASIAYGILDLERKNNTNKTMEPVKSAIITVNSTTDKNSYFVPYGAMIFTEGVFDKDYIVGYGGHNEERYQILQVTRPDNFILGDTKYIDEKMEEVYREQVKTIYTTNEYSTSSMNELYMSMPGVYTYKGTSFQLFSDYSRNGYEVYIECIREYLRENYTYSLAPGKLEEGRDFLEKFMEDKEGYCTHFATMATLMFRNYGIPARYVEGYYVSPESDELTKYNSTGVSNIEVTDQRAHAWTEIYIDGYGWMPVEVTPGYAGPNYYTMEEVPEETTVAPPPSSEPNQEPTTTKKEENSSATDVVTTEGQDNKNEKNIGIDYSKFLKLAVVFLVLMPITVILGRRSVKNKRFEDVINSQNTNGAALEWKAQVEYMAVKYGKNISLTMDRTQFAKCLGYNIEYGNDILVEQLIEMFRIFDKAAYGHSSISVEEKNAAQTIARTVVERLYKAGNIRCRLYMKYIKCLYLK